MKPEAAEASAVIATDEAGSVPVPCGGEDGRWKERTHSQSMTSFPLKKYQKNVCYWICIVISFRFGVRLWEGILARMDLS